MSGPQNDSDQNVAAVGDPDPGSGQVPLLALRRREAAKALGIGERLLWSLTTAGEIPHCRLGRAVVYPVDELREFLKNQCAKKNGNYPR